MDTTNSPFFILANRDAFGSLSDDQQAALLEAGKEASVKANEVQLAVAAGGVEAFRDGRSRGDRAQRRGSRSLQRAGRPRGESVVAETGGDAQAIVDALSK
ncbi:hypothetical protein [Salipiger sp. CCB-MM3]|uniref:hypothetical protein n=1 Tax=Salipiger sp. CCB-MM3 TaxID=1792508 RepID=UPI001F3FB0B6|nr:hypothetical protein [Salipiger sp. CCB-MM3]